MFIAPVLAIFFLVAVVLAALLAVGFGIAICRGVLRDRRHRGAT
jgi:hypothetical protein